MGKPLTGLILALVFCLATGIVGTAGLATQAVVIESSPRTVFAGPGQKPFDVTRHTIPISEIRFGGPPRDGIPALVRPKFVSANELGRQLKDSNRVLGIFLNGEAKAYPIRILNWHELVNDTVGGRALLVSW